jgi:hypothetical protein
VDFLQELQSIFGDPDRRGRAFTKLMALKMKETSHVHRYTVTFKEYADDLRWSEPVLREHFYNRLPDRIKDIWTQSDPPEDFHTLIREAQRADNRHWKRIDEKKGKAPARSDTKSQPKTATISKSSSTPSRSSTSHSTSTSASTSLSRVTTTSASKPAKDLTKILGADGKLLPEEKARHKKLGLCTYCAEKHVTDNCLSRPASSKLKEGSSDKSATSAKTISSSKPKGQVAQVVDPDDSTSDIGDAAESDF